MTKHRVVVVSKDGSFRLTGEAAAKASAAKPGLEFEFIGNNSRPLAEVYNGVLDRPDAADQDFTYFVHADALLDFAALAGAVEVAAAKYDVMGLCGCAKLSVSESPLNWYCGSRPFPGDRWGCVSHGELGGQEAFFSQHHPDQADHEVACIDGLCIILGRKAVAAGLRFDPSVGAFDCYDTDLSMQAVLKYGLRLGVVVRRDLQHYSIGRQIQTEGFARNELALRRKWGFPVPKRLQGLDA